VELLHLHATSAAAFLDVYNLTLQRRKVEVRNQLAATSSKVVSSKEKEEFGLKMSCVVISNARSEVEESNI